MAQQREPLSFSVLNEAFRTHLPDPALAETRHFNLYKVYQHAITYALNGSRAKRTRHYFDLPFHAQLARFKVRSIRSKSHLPRLKSVVFYDEVRRGKLPEGRTGHFFYHRLMVHPQLSNHSIIAHPQSIKDRVYDCTTADLAAVSMRYLDATEQTVLRDLNTVYRRLSNHVKIADFQAYLGAALSVFFESFHGYYTLFKANEVRVVVLTCHYHNEGLIAACKLLGIRCIELQHGLIARNDLYYVYPESIAPYRDRALFPDKLVVFGAFWKKLLAEGHEFTSDQIVIGGNYSLDQHRIHEAGDASVRQNAILVCTQKNMAHDYLPYLDRLQALLEQHQPDWKLWIKLHPKEKDPAAYDRYREAAQCTVYSDELPLSALLAAARIQITIYSTTLFDAIGTGIMNFALQAYGESRDYAREMLDHRVAYPLQFNDDVIERYHYHEQHPKAMASRDDLYAPYDETRLVSLINFE